MHATQEEWLPAVNWEGLYEVSNRGRVRSLDRVVIRSDGRPHTVTGRILKPYRSPKNYYRVNLSREGKTCWIRVHNLVLETFVGPRPHSLIACHGREGSAVNAVENLRWDTYESNSRDTIRDGNNHNANKTHCKHGHEYTPKNTIIKTNGARRCRTCQYAAKARWKASKGHSIAAAS